MPNLGSSDTPVEGQSFGLPAGAELGEDNGELVIKDSSGTIILRRNETASEWQFEGTDLTGINSIDASSATLDDQTINQSLTDPNGTIHDSKLVSVEPWNIQPAYTSGPAHGEGGNAFTGAAPLPDGRVVLAPRDSSNVGLSSPYTVAQWPGVANR